MKFKRSALLTFVLLAGAAASRTAQAQTAPIIPRPEHAVLNQGAVDISHGLAFDSNAADADATSVVSYLKGLLNTTHGPVIVAADNGTAPRLLFVRREPHPVSDNAEDESYELSLSPKEIRIIAGSHAGYLYGAISLWQLVSHANGTVGVWQIEDAPRFRWRGIMLDSARHMQSENSILQLLDYMAEHKLNIFHWHLVDDQGWRLEIKRYPLLTSVGAFRPQTMPPYQPGTLAPTGQYGGFYTQDQVRHIVAYAKARNITVVPEIEMPGHATAPIVAYPQLGSSTTSLTTMPVGWGIFPNLYNPTDSTFEFLRNVLLEVMDLFPSEYIHLGGDEAIKEQWKANSAIQQQIRSLGLKDEDALQGWFMAQMETFLQQHGRKMVGWDEILDGGISRSATVMSWRGMQGGIAAAKSGHDAILSPTRPLYFNYRQSGMKDEPAGRDPINSLADVYNFQANPEQLAPAEQSHILGVQGNIWTEYVLRDDTLQHLLFPRAAALAELAWSPASARDFNDFLLRLPADNQRAQDGGVRPAQSVFMVKSDIGVADDGKHAMVALSTQGNVGNIHYTLDGSLVDAKSPVYTAPFEVTLPTSLQGLAFAGNLALSQPVVEQLTLSAALARDSRELDPCRNVAGIQMEQDPIRNTDRPVFRVVFSSPCWIYRKASMATFNSLTLSVGSIPYIFRGPNEKQPSPSTSSSTTARIAIYLDSCGGELLATAPLEPAYEKDGATTLPPVSFARQQGMHDLCFRVQDADPATVWLLHTIQPVPREQR